MQWTNAALTGTMLLVGSAAMAQNSADHKIVTPKDIKWVTAPPSVPKGAEMAVLYGDPTKDGPFAMRLKFPANYAIAPHTHPAPEIVTILSGTLGIGMGEKADKEKIQALPAGSFFGFPPGMTHFVFVSNEETIVQINSNGPWGIKYVNAGDDPRQAK